jgi:predicted dehydrogenase
MGVPQGARTAQEAVGWYADPNRSGGGVLMDLGVHALELAWGLLGYAKPETVLAVEQRGLTKLDVEESATLLVRLEGGRSIELSVAWAVHLPPTQYGVACRVSGDSGVVDVYTPQGPVLYRGEPGKSKMSALKGPKMVLYPAMFRHLKSMIQGGQHDVLLPAKRALTVMQMLDSAYRSIRSGKSVEVRE